MSLTQSQLDEAMKPAKFDAHVSVGESTFTASEGSVPLASISAKDKSFSSAASPIDSLLAGEKIQFGEQFFPCEVMYYKIQLLTSLCVVNAKLRCSNISNGSSS